MMDKLHEAIKEWYEASKAYDEALENYEGYSWGWAGHSEIERRQKAAEDFEAALNELIDRRIREKIMDLTF